MADQEVREAVIRMEEQSKNMAATVEKLAKTVDRHVGKTSDAVKDLHVKIDEHKKDNEGRFVAKETHNTEMRSIRVIVKSIAGSLVTLATGAVAYLMYGKS